DRTQAAGAVIDGIHRRDDGEKNLSGADVTRRFVAANVLLAGLHREPVTWAAHRIVRDADEAPGHVPFVGVARGEISGMRSAETERNTETLGAADGDIGAEFAGRFEQRQRENVRGNDEKSAGIVRGFGE